MIAHINYSLISLATKLCGIALLVHNVQHINIRIFIIRKRDFRLFSILPLARGLTLAQMNSATKSLMPIQIVLLTQDGCEDCD